MSRNRHDMSDAEWGILYSILPHKHEIPERARRRRVMNGIFLVLRTGRPWRDLLQPPPPVEQERRLGIGHGGASKACGR